MKAKHQNSIKDRECTPLTQCNTVDYSTIDQTWSSAHIPREYVKTMRTYNSDQVCQPLTKCSRTQYENVPPTHTQDRQCATLTNCDDKLPECSHKIKTPAYWDGGREIYTSDNVCELKEAGLGTGLVYFKDDNGVCTQACGPDSVEHRGFCRGVNADCSDAVYGNVSSDGKYPIGNWILLKDMEDPNSTECNTANDCKPGYMCESRKMLS